MPSTTSSKRGSGGAGISGRSVDPRPPETVPGDTARYGYITNRFLEVELPFVDGVGKAMDSP